MEKMNNSAGERMAYDDVFFSIVLIVIGLYASSVNWNESDWSGLFGTVLLTAFGGLWLSVRIYHLTHKEEVFGPHDDKMEYGDLMDKMYTTAEEVGMSDALTAWLDLDGIWWPNPHYKGEPIPHPEDPNSFHPPKHKNRRPDEVG